MNELAKNIRKYRKLNGLSQDSIAEKLGYKSFTTIQKWETGVSEPSISKLHELARIFNIDVNDLVNPSTAKDEEPFYLDPETAKLAQDAFDDPDTRILLSAKRDLSPESMKAIMDMVKLLKKKDNPGAHPEDFADDIYPDEFNQDPE